MAIYALLSDLSEIVILRYIYRAPCRMMDDAMLQTEYYRGEADA